MQRYVGGPFFPGSRIALIANDALGNFVVCTPLLRMLRDQVEDAQIDLYSGSRIAELASRSPLVDRHSPLFGISPRQFMQETEGREYDLIINVEDQPWAISACAALAGDETEVVGRCLTADGRGLLPLSDDSRGRLMADPDWIGKDMPQRYPFLDRAQISEIFCRLVYLEGPVPPAEVPVERPAFQTPEVLVSASASLKHKLWPIEKWRAVLDRLKSRGLTIGVLGAKPGPQARFWDGTAAEQAMVDEGLAQDLRGRLTLPEVAGAMARSRLVLTLDNGLLHMACAAGAPTVGLFRHGIHRLWAPPVENLTVLEPGVNGLVEDLDQELVLASCLKNIKDSL